MTLIRYCEDLKGDNPEFRVTQLSKKAICEKTSNIGRLQSYVISSKRQNVFNPVKINVFFIKLQLCFITKNRCVPKSTSMYLYKILFKYNTYINLHFIETFNTDYVRHFNYVRQIDRHNLNFDVGGIVIQLVGKYRF
jgi:hypothetical protein